MDGLEEQERESEGVAIDTPARSERKGAADGAGWLGRYAVGSRLERGPHKHRGPHSRQRSSPDRGPHSPRREDLFSFTICVFALTPATTDSGSKGRLSEVDVAPAATLKLLNSLALTSVKVSRSCRLEFKQFNRLE